VRAVRLAQLEGAPALDGGVRAVRRAQLESRTEAGSRGARTRHDQLVHPTGTASRGNSAMIQLRRRRELFFSSSVTGVALRRRLIQNDVMYRLMIAALLIPASAYGGGSVFEVCKGESKPVVAGTGQLSIAFIYPDDFPGRTTREVLYPIGVRLAKAEKAKVIL